MSQSIPVILEALLPYPWLSSQSRPLANRLSRERMPLKTKQRSPTLIPRATLSSSRDLIEKVG